MTALIPKKEGTMTLSDSTLTDTGRVTLGWNPTHTVATVLLDRPTKLNALTPEMLDELFDCLRTVHDSEARVMVCAEPVTRLSVWVPTSTASRR